MKKVLLTVCMIATLFFSTNTKADDVKYWNIVKADEPPYNITVDGETSFTVDDVWEGIIYIGNDDFTTTKNYMFTTKDGDETFIARFWYYSGTEEEGNSYIGEMVERPLKYCSGEPTIKAMSILDHLLKQYVFTTESQIQYINYSFNTGYCIVDFLYCAPTSAMNEGYDSFVNKIVPSITLDQSSSTSQTVPDPTPTPTPSALTEKDFIRSDIKSRINSEYANTTIDSITVNDDLGAGSGYIATVNLTWNVQNTAKTTKEMLKMYSDDLAATIAQEYDSLHEIAIFWKVPYLTDKTSKWAYTCRDGGAYLSDNIVSFE